MQKTLMNFLILLFVMSNSLLFAQEIHDEQGKEKASNEPSVTGMEIKVEKYQTTASESLDSLSVKTMEFVNNTTDSLDNLAKLIETNTTGSCSGNLN